MSLTVTVNSVDVTDKVRLGSIALEMSALKGTVGTSLVDIDDTTGSANLAPLSKEWVVTESEATPTTIAGGYVAERGLQKGPLTAGTQRQFAPVFEDWNTALTDKILRGGRAKRPEETDYERVTWLLGNKALSMLDGAGTVPNTNTVDMDATDYRGKTALDVLDDCADASGKNFFVYFVQGTGWVLFYDKDNTTFSSSLQISDDVTDIDNSTTFGPSQVDYSEDPQRIYSGILVKWASGWVYESDATTQSTYRNLHRTVVKENIKTAKRAREWAERTLARLDEPTKKLSLTVSVPASKLGDLRAGQRIQVKLRSRGITAFTYFRIVGATISPRQGGLGYSDVEYDVRLKMRDKVRPVNLDDTFGGGDSTGGQSTGGGSAGSGASSGGTDDTGTYVLDDFARDVPAAPSASGASTSSAGTSHTINLPDGCNAVGSALLLFVIHNQGTTEDIPADLETDYDFTEFYHTLYGSYNTSMLWRTIDGTEGFSGSGDSLSATTTANTDLGVVAVLFDGVTCTTSDYDYIIASQSSTADPPALGGWVDTASNTRLLTACFASSSVSGDPSGYANIGAGDPSSCTVRVSTKTLAGFDDSDPDEDPSTYTAGSPLDSLVIGFRESGWGSILQGGGVDTEAPWEGGNEWEGDYLQAIATVAGGLGILTARNDEGTADMRLSSQSAEHTDAGPWGPWSDSDGTILIKWKANPLGDTSYADPNIWEVDVRDGQSRSICRVHLGDNASPAWSYMAPAQQRGLVLYTGDGPTYSDFVAKTLSADTFYYLRFDFRGDTIKARMWAASADEPVDWDVTLAKEDETGLDDEASLYIRSETESWIAISFDQIDAAVGSSLGGSQNPELPPGDGTTTTWTIEPWVGSLRVWVDGIETPVDSYDRDAGTFTFDRAPTKGAYIRAEYTPA